MDDDDADGDDDGGGGHNSNDVLKKKIQKSMCRVGVARAFSFTCMSACVARM